MTVDHVEAVGSGAARQGKQKWPRQSAKKDFGVDQSNALTVVAEHFKFAAQGDLL